ncbi:MAG: hypothetical protein QOC63_4828 [Mycobacterium sp.]|nr:hypothetical protein [Mycobacterium sp.]
MVVQFVPVQDQLIGVILSDSGNGIQVLSGILGSGKTSILRHLKDSRAYAVRVQLEDFNPGHHGQQGDTASVGAVQASFQQFEQLLQTLISRVGTDDVLDVFRGHVQDVRNSDVHDAKVDRIKDSFDECKSALAPKDLADAWRRAAGAISDKFKDLWNARTEQQRCLLLLDNVDEISDQEMGIWLGELLPRLSGTTIVLTEKSGAVSIVEFLPASANITSMVNFDDTAVRSWLENAVGQTVKPAVCNKIYRVSNGHPATVALVHDLLWGSGLTESGRAQMLEELKLPGQDGQPVAALADRLVRRMADDLMARALQAAAIPRQFDVKLLGHLLDDPQITTEAFRSVVDRLANLSFVEDIFADERHLRVHPFVRRGLLERMYRYDPDLFKDFNDRAASYYDDQINKITEGKPGENYGDAFVYEKPKWQQYKREWLYHRCLASRDAEKHAAIVEISQLFFDAFWWWGNYVHFDFCDQLVTDVARLAEVRRAPEGRPLPNLDVPLDDVAWPELGELYEALRFILSHYPLRSVKPREAAWRDIRDALLSVEDLCGGGKGLKDRKHLAALLKVFLAHTYHYQVSPVIEQTANDYKAITTADKYYKQAEELFGDEWSASWVAFERADMGFQSGWNVNAVREHWARSAGLVQSLEDLPDDPDEEPDDPDEELSANLHRLRADLLWSKGRKKETADAYRRAVIHAYLFHEVVKDDLADEYTMQFYIDIRMRAVSRLFELNDQSGAGAAVPFARRMSTISADTRETDGRLEELIRDHKPLPLAHALFPRGPWANELGKLRSEFHKEFLRNRQALKMSEGNGIWRDLLGSAI